MFIATESGRTLDEDRIPAEVATSVVTLAELQRGVLAAKDSDIRAVRLATLDTVADMEVLPVDEGAARMWGRLRGHLAETGRRVWVSWPHSVRPFAEIAVVPDGETLTTRGQRRAESRH